MSEKLRLELDASQIKTFLKCPMQWYYEYNQRITNKSEDSKRPMNMGTYGHTRLQKFYELRAENYDFKTANHMAVNMAETNEEVLMLPNDADRLTVLTGVMGHNAKYKSNDIIPLNKDAVEVGFSIPLFESATRQYIICGRTDVIGTLQGLTVIMDHKFQLRESYIFNREIQFKTYIYAMNRELGPVLGPITTFVVNYIRLTKGYTETTYKRDLISFNYDEIELWGERLIRIFDKVADFLQYEKWNNDDSHNWAMCGDQKYGSGICEFAQICNAPSKAASQEKLQLYRIKPAWTPWKKEEKEGKEIPIETTSA